MRCRWIWPFLAAIGLLATGCSAFVDQDQVQVTSEAGLTLAPGNPVGQTFVAHHAGLCGVEVWLEAEQSSRGDLYLHLQSEPEAVDGLVTAVLPLEQVTGPGFYRLSFPPLRESHGRYYYAFLEVKGEGELDVGTGPGPAYLDGALYRDHEPQDIQMSFRLVYDPRWTLVDLGWAAVSGLRYLFAAFLLYLIPGWALLSWLWPADRLPWIGKLTIAVGLSLALYPLLFLWTDLLGVRLGPLYAWLPPGGGLVALVWRYRSCRPRVREALRRWVRSEALWPDLAFLALAGLVFGVRLLVVRTLDVPMWGDSYQHTAITQLLVDHGGLFDSWEPYAPLQSFTYHFGFHAAAAAFHWLTGLGVTRTVIWVGQVLNGAAVIALYPLAVRASGSRWAGTVAVLIAGLLSPMPMFYINWGRYTQLAGQIILPAAVVLSWAALENQRRDWRQISLCWIATGGLALTHFRVLIFYILFVAAWAILSLRRGIRRRVLPRVTRVGIGAAVLFLPWFIHTFAGGIPDLVERQLTTAASRLPSYTQHYNAIGDLTTYLPPIAWLLLGVAIGVGLWRRRRGVLLTSLWWLTLLIVANPAWLSLPGSGAISNFALFIAAYIPAGVLIGGLFAEVVSRLPRRWWVTLATLICVVAVGLGGARIRIEDVRVSQHTLVTRPDLQAMAWIEENTAKDARFLANSFLAYGERAIVGSDGGWWLPLLAGRANTVPPLNYRTEQGPWPEYRERVLDIVRQLQQTGVDDPATLALLEEQGITHVYVGQQQGRVNYRGPDVLDPAALLDSPHYRPVYHQDRVWIFELVY